MNREATIGGSGEDGASSLWGRIRASDIGSRVHRDRPNAAIGVVPGDSNGNAPSKKATKGLLATAELLANSAMLGYRPRTRETAAAWDFFVAMVHEVFGGETPRDVTASAADEILAILKDSSLRDLDRKESVESVFGDGPISTDRYAQLSNLAKRLTDYVAGGPTDNRAIPYGEAEDDEQVAVVFAEEDDNEDDVRLTGEQTRHVIDNDLEDHDHGHDNGRDTGHNGLGSPGEVGTVDLERMAFVKGGHTMTNKACVLPDTARRTAHKGYDEIYIPAPAPRPMGPDERLIPIEGLPSWMHAAFAGGSMTTLNRVQSRVCSTALESDDNFLVCAPTGAGKTNVALLAMLRTMSHFREDSSTSLSSSMDGSAFKMVYIAPMKALVQEMVATFSSRLAPYGLRVGELTGDAQLSRAELASVTLIVTTPEKWDVITRKTSDTTSFVRLVRLLIVDEVHLLHDMRGPVLEAVIARTRHLAAEWMQPVRVLGLSATLPNWADVGRFLGEGSQTFYFDGGYRPCPLAQTFVGVAEGTKPLRRMRMLDEIVSSKVVERAAAAAADGSLLAPVIVFVHSRKDTFRTARLLRDALIAAGHVNALGGAGVMDEAFENGELRDLAACGVAVHNAGLCRGDRSLVERLFTNGNVRVLVSTATLAWGVNLPAHTVFIKGTQVYDAEKGSWTELSTQDVLQMLGRAGRPQFDSEGEGIIVTGHAEVSFYLSLLTSQLPIESQLVARLPDHLNAEVVLGTVRSLSCAVAWLHRTYLAVRMAAAPAVYGLGDYFEDQIALEAAVARRLLQVAHTALLLLDRGNLVRYAARGDASVSPTELGRIASHYYLGHASVAVYNSLLRPTAGIVEVLQVFAASGEFRLLPVRSEERAEVARLAERVPIPVRDTGNDADGREAKVIVLLQSYISRLSLTGMALAADMVYVSQSCGRILRALHEMCIFRGWARVARTCLDLCRMAEHRQWQSQTPLRQASLLPGGLLSGPDGLEALRRLERKDFAFDRLFDLDAQQLGELVRLPQAGPLLLRALQAFPRLTAELVAHHSLTRELYCLVLSLDVQFGKSAPHAHRMPLSCWVIVEGADGETVLYSEYVRLTPGLPLELVAHVSFGDNAIVPPVLLVRVCSDRYLAVERTISVTVYTSILAERRTVPTVVADVSGDTFFAADHPEIAAVYANVSPNLILDMTVSQRHCLGALFRSGGNVLIGGREAVAGLLGMAELAIWRTLIQRPGLARIVFLTPNAGRVLQVHRRWSLLYGGGQPCTVAILCGDPIKDGRLLDGRRQTAATDAATSCILVGEPRMWDRLARRWRTKRSVQGVHLLVCEDLHQQGDGTMEIVLSRTRLMASAAQTEDSRTRIVALGAPLWNTKDVASWLGVAPEAVFNFEGPRPALQVHTYHGSNQSYSLPILQSLHRPAVHFAVEGDRNAGIFVDDSMSARRTAVDLCALVAGIRGREERPIMNVPVTDGLLRECMLDGVVFVDAILSEADLQAILSLLRDGSFAIAVVSRDVLWAVLSCGVLFSRVVIMGTQSWQASSRSLVDYPLGDVLAMVSLARDTVLVQCHVTRRAHLLPLLQSCALPMESVLDQHLADHLNGEIAAGTVGDCAAVVDYLTWTLFYRRLGHNPNYYGLRPGASSVSALDLSSHLSELVERTVGELVDAKCIQEDHNDGSLSSLNLGMIAAHYGVQCQTVEMLALSLTAGSRVRAILECVSAAAEFDSLWIAPCESPDFVEEESLLNPCLGESSSVWQLAQRVPHRPTQNVLRTRILTDPHLRTNLLLQAHLMREPLEGVLVLQQKTLLPRALTVVHAAVDVLASLGWLSAALAAMEVSQMLVQAVWDNDPPLRQALDNARALEMAVVELGISSVYDVDAEVLGKLPLTSVERRMAAALVNAYPVVEASYSLDMECVPLGGDFTVQVALSSDDDNESNGNGSGGLARTAVAPRFPAMRDEGWWLLVGNPADRTLLGIKRFTLSGGAMQLSLDFAAPNAVGPHKLRMYLVCDCYAGADQQFDLEVAVLPQQE